MDIINELGELAFASRLKRLGERLAKDVTILYGKLDIDFKARWFPVFYALTRHSPITVTGLADSIGISHTAVKQLAKEMAGKGLVTWSKGRDDKRQQLISITPGGKATAVRLSPVWEEIRKGTKELLGEAGCGALGGIEKIETLLDKRNMYERVWLGLKGSLPCRIEIRDYRPALKKYFKSLNYEWLKEHFSVEDADEKMLSDPQSKILKKGGGVIFAMVDGDVAGTCAMIRHANGTFELAKMAVDKRYRRRGIGGKLIGAVIERARTAGADALYLRTNPRLKAANSLYKKTGFRKTERDPLTGRGYERSTFAMKLDL